jgi:AcrR family transcriptional regulator
VKAEAVRSPSQVKIAHGAERRESEPRRSAERRESEPRGSAERRESEPKPVAARDRRDSRWDEHRRARREQLVDAALAAVSKHGAGVGMDEIAAEAGTSKTVVYRHFADRSALHVAVCSRVAGQLLAKLREAMQSSSHPQQMTAAAIETYLAFLEADPEVYRFVVTQHPAGDPVDPVATLADLIGEQAATLMAVALPRARGVTVWWDSCGRPLTGGSAPSTPCSAPSSPPT